VQAHVLPEEAPWHASSVDSSLINFGSKQENPELMKNLALEKINKGSIHIFTDAYKTKITKHLLPSVFPNSIYIEHKVKLKKMENAREGKIYQPF